MFKFIFAAGCGNQAFAVFVLIDQRQSLLYEEVVIQEFRIEHPAECRADLPLDLIRFYSYFILLQQ